MSSSNPPTARNNNNTNSNTAANNNNAPASAGPAQTQSLKRTAQAAFEGEYILVRMITSHTTFHSTLIPPFHFICICIACVKRGGT